MIGKITGALACVLVAAGSGFAEEGRWMLMSRHGDCAEIAVLGRKVRDMGTVTSPDQFIERIRAKGYEVERTDYPGGAVGVVVPKLELSPMFVRYETCTEFTRKDPKVPRD